MGSFDWLPGLLSKDKANLHMFLFEYDGGQPTAPLIVIERGDDYYLYMNKIERLPRGTVRRPVELDDKYHVTVGGRRHLVQGWELIRPSEAAPADAEPLPEYLQHHLPHHVPDDAENPDVIALPLERDRDERRGDPCPECGEPNPKRALRCVECNETVDERVRELQK